MIKTNKENITHIKLSKEKPLNYHYLPEKEVRYLFFWKDVYKEGYYYNSNYNSILDTLEKTDEMFVRNNELFQKPYVQLHIGSKCVGIKYFDTISEAKTYARKEFPNLKYTL